MRKYWKQIQQPLEYSASPSMAWLLLLKVSLINIFKIQIKKSFCNKLNASSRCTENIRWRCFTMYIYLASHPYFWPFILPLALMHTILNMWSRVCCILVLWNVLIISKITMWPLIFLLKKKKPVNSFIRN